MAAFHFSLMLILYGQATIFTFRELNWIFNGNIPIFIWLSQSVLLREIAKKIIKWRFKKMHENFFLLKNSPNIFLFLIEEIMICSQYFSEYFLENNDEYLMSFKKIMTSHFNNCDFAECQCSYYRNIENKSIDKLMRMKKGILSLNGEENFLNFSKKSMKKVTKKKALYKLIEHLMENKLKMMAKREMTFDYENFFFIYLNFLIKYKRNFTKVYFMLCLQRKNTQFFSFTYILGEKYYQNLVSKLVLIKKPKIYGDFKKKITKYLDSNYNFDTYFNAENSKNFLKKKIKNILEMLIIFWEKMINGFDDIRFCLDKVLLQK